MFSQVSVCPQGGGGVHPPLGRHRRPRHTVTAAEITYWNAFLFANIFAENCMEMKKIGPRMGAHISGAPLDLPTLHMLCTDSDNKKDVFFDWIYDAFKIFRFPFLVLPDLCTAFLWSTLLKLKYIYIYIYF